MSALPVKRFRVVVIEWLSHDAIIEAPDAAAAGGCYSDPLAIRSLKIPLA